MEDESFEGVIYQLLFRLRKQQSECHLDFQLCRGFNPFDFHYRPPLLPYCCCKADEVYTPIAPLDHKPQRELSEKQYPR